MNIIKTFKLFESMEYWENYFSTRINFDLIKDLKDLSLDLIDIYCRLIIDVYYGNEFVYHVDYDHNEDISKYIIPFNIERGVDKFEEVSLNIVFII